MRYPATSWRRYCLTATHAIIMFRVIVFDITDVETVEEVPPEKPGADTLHDLLIRAQFAGDEEPQVFPSSFGRNPS